MRKVKDISGQTFGNLEVLEFVEVKNHRAYFRCKCKLCGNICVKQGQLITSGKTRSCGCFAKNNTDQTTHGFSKTHLYGVWCNMKRRCYIPKAQNYEFYGGRGIKVCDEWRNDYLNFHNWAYQNGYADGLTLDRVNTDGDYSPDNCRWVDMKTQNNNKRSNRMITYNGKTQTMHQWAEEYGIKYTTLHMRITKYKWDIEKALNTP